jgi:hypothetical protein
MKLYISQLSTVEYSKAKRVNTEINGEIKKLEMRGREERRPPKRNTLVKVDPMFQEFLNQHP